MSFKNHRFSQAFIIATFSIILLATPKVTFCGIKIEAIQGEPFGVGRIVANVPKEMLPRVLGPKGIGLSEKDGRVLYPAIYYPEVSPLVKDLLNGPISQGGPLRVGIGGLIRDIVTQPQPTTIFFLFRGNEPLQISVQLRQPQSGTVVPRHNPTAYGRLLGNWWKHYTAQWNTTNFKPNHPPLVKNYLSSMLSYRLGLRMPATKGNESWKSELGRKLGLMLGTEAICASMLRDRMLQKTPLDEPAGLPLPAPITDGKVRITPTKQEIEIEPIASRVPVECFYIRFGSFANFIWIQDTQKRWGDDFSNLVSLRALDPETSKRLQERLALKQTKISRMLGGTLIADVAMIGTDMFDREGPANGLLFLARNSTILGFNFNQERSSRVAEGDGVTEKKITIKNKTVSLLSNPEGTVRSYYAVDGDYHFFTSSKSLVEKFLATASGKGSLSTSEEFRHARSVIPLNRDDTVFVYFSAAFFRNFTGPHYHIEIARRLQAVADIEMLQLALLAAANEGRPCDTIPQLITGLFLPPDFGQRPDGSRTVLKDGRVFDSVRGKRGFFVPIPDVKVDKITRSELEQYQEFATYFASNWGYLDPMIAGIKRHELKNNREKIVLDVVANPFSKKHFDTLSKWLGPPNKNRMAPVKGNLFSGDLILTDQHLFGGIHDVAIPFSVENGRFVPLGGILNSVVGYIGTNKEGGFLSILTQLLGLQLDPTNLLQTQLHRQSYEQFTVFSFQKDLLARVVPQLRVEEAERPAQIRIQAGDVSKANLHSTLNTMSYLRTRKTSLSNILFMHTLAEQLKIPGPECLVAAELLLDSKLICPLGGKYKYVKQGKETGYWTSTAWNLGSGHTFRDTKVPKDYDAPPLNWFRGLDMDATMTRKALSVHAEIEMHLPEDKN